VNTHPQAAHNDIEGPLLFVGGNLNGEFRSVNRSRVEWVVPLPDQQMPDVEVYCKRRYHLGGPTGPIVTVMVKSHTSDDLAQRLLLARIAEGLAEGKW
jgi:hypothetical protein